MRRRLLVLIPTFALTLALVACGSDGADEPASGQSSPPPPAQAPAAVTQAAAAAVAPSTDGGSTSGETGGAEGTPFAVNLEDPGKSGKYEFNPSAIEFKVGDTVTFTFTAETEFHTFTVDDLDIDVAVDADGTEKLTFTFAKAGTFDIICIPHESLGMSGTITVQ